MIKPVNKCILIEPVKYRTFVSSTKETYEEIGVVVELPLITINDPELLALEIGDRIYFDRWNAGKYPKNSKEWYWLVSWEDVKAIEKKFDGFEDDDKISE